MTRIKFILLSAFLTCGGGAGHAQVKKRGPETQAVGLGVVWRTSEKKDAHGMHLPPWKEVKVANVFGFKRRPVLGSKVTVIPLGAGVPPLDLRIVKAVEKEDACDESLPNWWEVELEPIKLREFFDAEPLARRAAEFPFDVAVLYPAVKGARQIDKSRLVKSELPKGVALDTVTAALDLTDDGKPDVLFVEYCCGDEKRPADDCDYTCGKTYMKSGNSWKLVDTSAPC
jgi:hypothetical protein